MKKITDYKNVKIYINIEIWWFSLKCFPHLCLAGQSWSARCVRTWATRRTPTASTDQRVHRVLLSACRTSGSEPPGVMWSGQAGFWFWFWSFKPSSVCFRGARLSCCTWRSKAVDASPRSVLVPARQNRTGFTSVCKVHVKNRSKLGRQHMEPVQIETFHLILAPKFQIKNGFYQQRFYLGCNILVVQRLPEKQTFMY